MLALRECRTGACKHTRVHMNDHLDTKRVSWRCTRVYETTQKDFLGPVPPPVPAAFALLPNGLHTPSLEIVVLEGGQRSVPGFPNQEGREGPLEAVELLIFNLWRGSWDRSRGLRGIAVSSLGRDGISCPHVRYVAGPQRILK